jgi:hypothetical protein
MTPNAASDRDASNGLRRNFTQHWPTITLGAPFAQLLIPALLRR